MIEKITRPVWAEINIENLVFNFQQVKKRLHPSTILMPVIKGDAAGHGAIVIAKVLIENGADRLAVAIPEEGLPLRDSGVKCPIHILGEIAESQSHLLIDYDLTPTVSKLETVKVLNELAVTRKIKKKVHIKIDTGLNRIGITPGNAVNFIEKVLELSNIEIEGLMTHFAKADEINKEFTFLQYNRFIDLIKELEKKEINIPIKHAANSAAIIDLPQMQLDMVRPGCILYGLLPSSEVDQDFPCRRVLDWKAKVVYVKEVPSGTPIGYGGTYVTERNSKLATIPLGFADGYPRQLSNKGEVLIGDSRVPIRGKICMDQLVVDVSCLSDIKVGDEVVLIGKQGDEEITATEIADLAGTANDNVTSTIGKRVPRVYI